MLRQWYETTVRSGVVTVTTGVKNSYCVTGGRFVSVTVTALRTVTVCVCSTLDTGECGGNRKSYVTHDDVTVLVASGGAVVLVQPANCVTVGSSGFTVTVAGATQIVDVTATVVVWSRCFRHCAAGTRFATMTAAHHKRRQTCLGLDIWSYAIFLLMQDSLFTH